VSLIKGTDIAVAAARGPMVSSLSAGMANHARIPAVLELFRDLTAEGHDLTDPAIADRIPKDDVIRFCLRHEIMRDQVQQLRDRKRSYKVLIKAGFLRKFWLKISGYKQGDPLSPISEAIPVAELHRAKMTGCVSEYTTGGSIMNDAGLSVRARGVGAGGGRSFTLTFEEAVSINISCVQITVPVTYIITPWRNDAADRTIDDVTVTDVYSDDCNTVTISDDDPEHLCSGREEDFLSRVAEHEKLGARRAAGISLHKSCAPGSSPKKTWTVEQSRSFSFTLGDILDVTSQFTRQYSYSFTLAGGAEYVGFRKNRESEAFFWAWKALP
jgi:hypothetical protein